MWQDEILEELHRIREEHAKSFDYDIKAICEDWRRKQTQSGKQFVKLAHARQSNRVEESIELSPPTPPIMRVRNGRFMKTRRQR